MTLRLDGELPFEALIQERLETLPKARRQDWLRTLLVEGFKRECRQLNKVEGRSRSASASSTESLSHVSRARSAQPERGGDGCDEA